jgi:outer membrane protein
VTRMPPPRRVDFRACSSVLAAAGLVFAAGCANPVGPLSDDYGRRVPLERLRSVPKLDKASSRAPEEAQTTQSGDRPKSMFEGVESVTMSVEDVRAAALTNNLDLKVALVNPTLAGEALREEEAKFEAVFRPSFSYRDSENPSLNRTQSGTSTNLNFGAGVDVPLRTGGRVSVDLSENRQESDNAFVTLNRSYLSDLTLRLSQPLLRGAGRRANTYSIRVAEYNRQISEAQTKLEVIRQLAGAERAYWRLVAAEGELEVRQKQYELATAQLDKAKRRVGAGDAASIEVTRAESGLASRLQGIIEAERQVLQRQRELKRVVNVPGLDVRTTTRIKPSSDPDTARYEFDADRLADLGVANRMEMLELELRLAADYSTIEFNKNQALPQLALDFQYSFEGLAGEFRPAFSRMGRGQFEIWQVGVNGQIPIGNEAAKARVQQAILTRLQRLSTKDARRQSIEQEVLNAVDNINSNWQQIQAARQSVFAAGRELEAEQRQFDAGARTSTDVLDAATRLADAESSLVQAVTAYQIAQVDLAFATGTLMGATGIDWSPGDPRLEVGPIGDDRRLPGDPTLPALPYTPWETAPPIGEDSPAAGSAVDPAAPANPG